MFEEDFYVELTLANTDPEKVPDVEPVTKVK